MNIIKNVCVSASVVLLVVMVFGDVSILLHWKKTLCINPMDNMIVVACMSSG